MNWWARLGGDEWSLQGLAEALPTDPRVWKDGDGRYYLSSVVLSACADEDSAWREVELTIAWINDAAMVLDRGHRPIVVQALVCVGDDGSRRVSVRVATATGHASGAARVRGVARVVRADGTVEPPGPSRLEQLYFVLKKEGSRSDLARGLKAWHSGSRDWGLLYHVYEIIKHDVSGGTGKAKALQAVTPPGTTWPELDNALNRFRGTANDPVHAGPEARHGKPASKPIDDPMSLREAEDLIRRLLETWINSKV